MNDQPFEKQIDYQDKQSAIRDNEKEYDASGSEAHDDGRGNNATPYAYISNV